MNILTAMKQALEVIERHPYSTELQLKIAASNLQPAIAEMERVEPVGRFVHQDFGGWQQVAKEFEHHTDTTPLFTHPQDRDSIIEECAGICDRFGEREMHPYECAGAIRALKGKK